MALNARGHRLVAALALLCPRLGFSKPKLAKYSYMMPQTYDSNQKANAIGRTLAPLSARIGFCSQIHPGG